MNSRGAVAAAADGSWRQCLTTCCAAAVEQLLAELLGLSVSDILPWQRQQLPALRTALLVFRISVGGSVAPCLSLGSAPGLTGSLCVDYRTKRRLFRGVGVPRAAGLKPATKWPDDGRWQREWSTAPRLSVPTVRRANCRLWGGRGVTGSHSQTPNCGDRDVNGYQTLVCGGTRRHWIPNCQLKGNEMSQDSELPNVGKWEYHWIPISCL